MEGSEDLRYSFNGPSNFWDFSNRQKIVSFTRREQACHDFNLFVDLFSVGEILRFWKMDPAYLSSVLYTACLKQM